MEGKELFSLIVTDNDTPIQKLALSEQLRVLIQRLINESKKQLKAGDMRTVYQLQPKANLLEFLCKATEKVWQDEYHSATVSVSSGFKPILEDMFQSTDISTYYTYTVDEPEIGYDIECYIQTTLEVKSY